MVRAPERIRHLLFINGGPIDQVVDIDVLHQKSGPIDQSDQLINGAQHMDPPICVAEQAFIPSSADTLHFSGVVWGAIAKI